MIKVRQQETRKSIHRGLQGQSLNIDDPKFDSKYQVFTNPEVKMCLLGNNSQERLIRPHHISNTSLQFCCGDICENEKQWRR